MVDPLTPNAIAIGPVNTNIFGSTWSGNRRLMGAGTSASVDLSTANYYASRPGIRKENVSRPSQVVMVGSAVTQEGETWGCYSTFSKPAALDSTNLDEIITPETGVTAETGGTMGGIAYRASGGNAAMFVMVDGSVKVIPKNQVKVSHFAAEL